MARRPTGTILVRSNVFYVRYRDDHSEKKSGKITRPLTIDGKPVEVGGDFAFRRRTKKAKKRGAKERWTYEFSDAVKEAFATFMRDVKKQGGAAGSMHNLTVGQLWGSDKSTKYGPGAKDYTYVASWDLPRYKLAESTKDGYLKTWRIYVKDHLSKQLVKRYTTSAASDFLADLAADKDLNKNSLAHVRSLMSGIFAYAADRGLIGPKDNPIRGVGKIKTRQPLKPQDPRRHYTDKEARAILKALESRTDAACIFALAFFPGLRPSEIAGLKWEDIEAERINIQRAAVHGKPGSTKTVRATEKLLLTEPVRSLLESWRVQRGGPLAEGYIFENQRRGPLNVESKTRHVLIPLIEAAGLTWKGLYSGRRGAGRALRARTGSPESAQQVLRHESSEVTEESYAQPTIEVGDAGMRLREAAWLAGDDK